VAGRRSIGAPV